MKPLEPSQITADAPQLGPHNRIPQLDAMRGVAALVVCLCHAVSMFPWTDASLPARLSRRAVYTVLDGAAMVDFFFVLSGFVLALPYFGPSGRRFDMIDFLTRRAARIYPAFWVAMTVALVLRLTAGDELYAWARTEWGQKQWTDPITAGDLVSQFALLTGGQKLNMLIGPIWSIHVEIQVAVVLPLFFLLIGPARSWRTVAAVGGLSVALAYMIGPPSALIFLPLFVMGVAAARFRVELDARVGRLSRPASVAIALLATALIYNRAATGRIGWLFPDLRPELISGVGATALVVLADGRHGFAAALVRGPLLLLGKVSYSLYLIHVPVFLALFPAIYTATSSVAACIAAGLVSAFALAWAMFYAVEQPCIDAGRRLAKAMAILLRSAPVPVTGAPPSTDRREPYGSIAADSTGEQSAPDPVPRTRAGEAAVAEPGAAP
jgi:peptidoglycan/LPS O-acetylase OafA/YrhL